MHKYSNPLVSIRSTLDLPAPDVSVVIAAHNESKHVREAVMSVVTQHGLRLEVVFVDDHSDDSTLLIVQSLAKLYPSIRIYTNPRQGKCAAFNFGISKAKGRFACIFAGDDIMPPGSLKERYETVAKESDDEFVVGLCKLVTMSDDKRFDGHLIPKKKGKGGLSGFSPLMNRKAVAVIFPTPESLPNEDTWMALALLHMPGWRIVHSNTVGCRWRCHSGNSVNRTSTFEEFSRKITVRMVALEMFMEKFSPRLDVAQLRSLQAKIDMERARRCGDWLGVLRSKVGFVDRLRALSTTNAMMFSIRNAFYGFFSGW